MLQLINVFQLRKFIRINEDLMEAPRIVEILVQNKKIEKTYLPGLLRLK